MNEVYAPQEFVGSLLVPAAEALGVRDAPHLMIGFGTGAHESGLRNVRQTGGGPALGPFQMEPATHDSLWGNFVRYHEKVQDALTGLLAGRAADPELMLADGVYAAAMMFVKYLSCPGAIPQDVPGQAAYYKKFYNTPLGAATVEGYLADYARLSAGVVFT